MDSINQPAPAASAPPTSMAAPIAAEPQMSQEQMKANLQEMMSKIEAKYQEFNTQKFSSNNKIKEQQGETLREIFDLFKTNGVDPSNVEEVGAFLKKIGSTNPELFKQVETALASILGEDLLAPIGAENSTGDVVPPEDNVPAEGAVPLDNNMNINTNETPPQS